MRSHESIFYGPNYDGSVGSVGAHVEELYARQETLEGGTEGYIVPFLREVALTDYFAYFQEKYPDKPHFQQIPEVLEAVLSPLFQAENGEKNGFLISGLARVIARGMSPDYWRIAQEYMSAGAWDPDMDLMVEGASVYELFDQLRDSHGGASQVTQDEKQPQRKKFTFTLDGFEVEVSVGKIPTSNIHNMIVSFFDGGTSRDLHAGRGSRIFHVDISELSQNPQTVLVQKRKGETSDWQDLVYARVSIRNSHLYYEMSPGSKEVMFRPNAIVTRSTEPAVLLEDVLRAIRIANLFPLEGITNESDQVIDRVDFGRFAPFFTSDSILKFQLSILRAVGSTEAIPEMNLKLIQDEFKLNFMVDPLWTIASLRDTTIGRLIPGLSDLTPRDWDAIMRADQFCLDVTPEYRLIPLGERDKAYIKRQRKIWRTEVDPDGQRYINGLERFLGALSDLGLFHFRSNTMEAMFSELWQKLPRRGDITIGTIKNPLPVPDNYVAAAKAGHIIMFYPPDRLPQSAEHIAQDGTTITAVATTEKPLKDRLESARQVIAHYMIGTVVEAILNSPDNVDRADSTALVYDMLEQYKFLTPRLLKILYDEEATEFTKSDLTDIVFDFKRLGLIDIYEQDREHSRGDIVTLETYSLDTGSKRSLTEIVNRNDFIDYLRRANRLHALASAVSLSEFLGIPTIEALLSLRDADYDLMKEKIRSRGYRDEVANELIDYISEFLRIYRSFAQETGLFATFD